MCARGLSAAFAYAFSATAHADLLLEAKVPSVAALSVFAGRDLPDQGPLDASLRLSGGEGSYSAQEIKLELDGELLKAVAEGAVVTTIEDARRLIAATEGTPVAAAPAFNASVTATAPYVVADDQENVFE